MLTSLRAGTGSAVGQPQRIVSSRVICSDFTSPGVRFNSPGPVAAQGQYPPQTVMRCREPGILIDCLPEQFRTLFNITGIEQQLSQSDAGGSVLPVDFRSQANVIDSLSRLAQPSFDIPQIIRPPQRTWRQAESLTIAAFGQFVFSVDLENH